MTAFPNDPDTHAEPIEFLRQCAWAHAEEYLGGRPDLQQKIGQAEKEIVELREKAAAYDGLCK